MGNNSLNKIIIIITTLIGLLIIIFTHTSSGQCSKFIQVTQKDTCSLITLDENTWTEFYMAKKKLDTLIPLYSKSDSINKRLLVETKRQSFNIESKVRFCEHKNSEYQKKIVEIGTENKKILLDNTELNTKVKSLRKRQLSIIIIAIITVTLSLIIR